MENMFNYASQQQPDIEQFCQLDLKLKLKSILSHNFRTG